jgi:hypothetical protein
MVLDNGYRMFETVDFTPDGKHFFVQTFNHLIFFNTATLNVSLLEYLYVCTYVITSFNTLHYQISFTIKFHLIVIMISISFSILVY